MAFMLTRREAALNPRGGLLLAEHFQMAYATTDIDRACELFGARFGIRKFRRLEGQMPAGGHIRAEFAWVGTIMYELIFASGPGSDIYMDRLPAGGGFRIKHHHLGFLIHDQDQWKALIAEAEKHGWPVPYHNVNSLVEACFVDVPELGHYLEYLLPQKAGLDFFESVPRH
jgi:Glyoxalase/Bleomycin resistance protein/Dioxygenase superfamily